MKGSSNSQCWEAQKGWGQWAVLLNPCVLSALDHCHAGSITEPSTLPLNSLANLTLSDTLPNSTSLECLFMQELRSKIGWAMASLRMSNGFIKSWTDSAKWDRNWVSNHYHTWGDNWFRAPWDRGTDVWLAGAVVWCDMAGCMTLTQTVSSY